MRFLLGLTIGAAVAMLLAPKSGRELRQQLIGGASGKLLPAAPDEFSRPEAERVWDTGGVATVVAEPEPLIEEAEAEEAIVEDPVAEELVVEEIAVAEVAEPGVEEVIAVAETVSISDDGVLTDTVMTTDTTTWAAPAAEAGRGEVPEPVAEEVPSRSPKRLPAQDLRPRIDETRRRGERHRAALRRRRAAPRVEPARVRCIRPRPGAGSRRRRRRPA